MKILVTAGGTEEPLDGVRRLANTSTGATGLSLSGQFNRMGADVFLLHSERIVPEGLPVETEVFLTFEDLRLSMQRLLRRRHFDAVVHLAAVSDYHLASIVVDGKEVESGGRGKIGTGHELVLRLLPNPKLIDSLRDWSLNPELIVVGFKLTDNPDPAVREAKVNALLGRGVADMVVHNDLGEIDGDRHLATIYAPRGVIAKSTNKKELAGAIYRLLSYGDMQ